MSAVRSVHIGEVQRVWSATGCCRRTTRSWRHLVTTWRTADRLHWTPVVTTLSARR